MTASTDDRRRNGVLIDIDGQPALRFERRYARAIDRVWRAVTDPGEMAAWFPSNVEGERAVGADLRFVDDAQRAAAREAGEPTRDEGPAFRGRVVVYDPPKVFSFTWGTELLRLELFPDAEGGGTRLVFTHVLSHQSIAARNGSGWHQCIGGLDALLGQDETETEPGAAAGPGTGAEWKDVYDDYLDRMGPSLASRSGGSAGSLTWERATHVDPDRVRHAIEDPDELGAWGAADVAGVAGVSDAHLHWDVKPAPDGIGTIYRLRHDGIGGDAELAARWHALLVQLDMYLAAGMLVPVEPKRWVDEYAELLPAS